ncbi:hypothetical protein KRMM14A1004_39460 [Krasilnikovia sp. MM14-A1004]
MSRRDMNSRADVWFPPVCAVVVMADPSWDGAAGCVVVLLASGEGRRQVQQAGHQISGGLRRSVEGVARRRHLVTASMLAEHGGVIAVSGRFLSWRGLPFTAKAA